ncbi:MAG: tellurite resistance TerB C-terminal domain-containing protein [Nostoc sp. DedVER02]|uniref:tellurite resistance TerB C-terminal domain-containing protein n=1 Tax=unclassified Nostoc TaxID=2593658 RepID=UPI002AD4AB12|nr:MULTISPECIES: tellurite resistance TerB C-terminal domain-containing protein [unclassified Nostoc]MDZ7984556.1 tellurite resistance TerB C-terminal domain-containing protein [Nostoc sp. DedVER02]MDZ8114400.1 tellurite resistance TerB C-terminal domain-containing protein [Nostoc sp. DedVER01b]
MQSVTISNRFILGIVAFSVSFGLSLVPSWDFNKAFLTGVITASTIYGAALFVDKRRRNYEMFVLGSLRKRIKEMEGLKARVVREINQIEEHHNLLYTESQKLQNQLIETRNQRDTLHRELRNCTGQKKQLETEINTLQAEMNNLQKNQTELSNAFSVLTAEKRRLESNCNVSRAEITQLQSQISELQQEKQEVENNVTLLGRLKPQLEEKLYELRVTIQELEVETTQKNQLLLATKTEKENIQAILNSSQTQLAEHKAELQQLQGQVSLLQEERDSLQNQVWELLQQLETFNQEPLPENLQEDDSELFPFSEIMETTAVVNTSEPDISDNLPEEWTNLLENLPGYELQVLKAIVEQDNPKAAIKKIAEANITMPNLLIDSINERANDTIGELIINSDSEIPKVYHEHITHVKKLIAVHKNVMARHPSSN